MYTTSRSRVLTGQECPRKRYWAFEHAGAGLLAPGDSLRLETGIAIHALLEAALKGEAIPSEAETRWGEQEGWEWNRKGSEKEQAAFIYVASKVMLPIIAQRLRQDFYVLLTEGVHTPTLTEGVTWYSREDGLLRDMKLGRRWVFSFKTCQSFRTDKHFNTARWAMQNTSEPWAAMKDGYEDIAGTVMLWFEVGEVKENRNAGQWERLSPLVRPYWNEREGKAYWSYTYEDEAGEARRAPKGSVRKFIGDIMPLDEWVLLLQRGEVIGQNLSNLVYGPVSFELDEERQKSWYTQVKGGEGFYSIASHATCNALKEGGEGLEKWKDCLDRYFEQHERACQYCSFIPLCWEKDGLVQIGKRYKLKRIREVMGDETS